MYMIYHNYICDSVYYIYVLFHILFYYKLLQANEFPVLYSKSLLVVCFVYGSVYLLIPNSKFLPLPSSPRLLLCLGVCSVL